jgi:hypothetical protein
MGGWVFVAWLVWRGESVGTTETRNEKVVDTKSALEIQELIQSV